MGKRRINNDTLEFLDGEDQVVLSVYEFLREKTMVIELTGQIRNEIAHDLEDEISAASFACGSVEIDMGGLTYIASMGLKALIDIKREADWAEGTEIVLTNVPEHLSAKLREAGYCGRIDIKGE